MRASSAWESVDVRISSRIRWVVRAVRERASGNAVLWSLPFNPLHYRSSSMSKSQDAKKATKKEPAKTVKEKKEVKKAKKEEKKRQQ